jgi:processive 1,2-diacylglycerol beta-glucosyltransferase
MDEYMSAADLVVGKPGGLTTTCEALAMGLVFVIDKPYFRPRRTKFRIIC